MAEGETFFDFLEFPFQPALPEQGDVAPHEPLARDEGQPLLGCRREGEQGVGGFERPGRRGGEGWGEGNEEEAVTLAGLAEAKGGGVLLGCCCVSLGGGVLLLLEEGAEVDPGRDPCLRCCHLLRWGG